MIIIIIIIIIIHQHISNIITRNAVEAVYEKISLHIYSQSYMHIHFHWQMLFYGINSSYGKMMHLTSNKMSAEFKT